MAKRLLFLGSDNISEICLKGLLDSFPKFNFELITTSPVSPPAKLANRSGILTYVESKGKMENWKILEPQSYIWKARYDYIVSASFGYLIPSKLIDHADKGLNMHPSLLPKYRGSSPIQYAIYNREKTTGVSIITIDPVKFDKGLILKQEEYPETIEKLTYETLSIKLAEIGAKLLAEVIIDYPIYLSQAQTQDESKVTKATKLPPEFSRLEFNSAEEIYAKYRCLKGTSMNPFVHFNSGRINIVSMRRVTKEELGILSESYPSAVPGSLWLIYPGIGKSKSTKFFRSIDPALYVRTADGWVVVEEISIVGKSHAQFPMKDFISSYFNIDSYLSMEDKRQEKGEYLVFD
jgi:methionyl-tRNA formyltransferase